MRGRCVLDPLPVLLQILDRVEPETIRAHLLQPVAHDLVHLLGDRGVGVVQIGHMLPEVAVVITAVLARMPALALRFFIRPDVPVALGGVGVLRLNEPRVLRRSVVEHQIDDDSDATLVGLLDEPFEVLVGPILRVDLVVVRDVVAVIAGRRHDRHQPDAGDTQVGRRVRVAVVQVIELTDQASQVAHPVAIAVVEAADEDLVERCVVPPGLAARAFDQRAVLTGRRYPRDWAGTPSDGGRACVGVGMAVGVVVG